MLYRNTVISYGSVSKFLHWTIFLLVSILLMVGFLMGEITDQTLKLNVYNVHKLFGLVVLLLMLFRVFWALTNPKPKLPDKTPKCERFLAYSIHFALYVLLLAMPLSGWIMASAAGKPPIIGSFKIALPILMNKNLAKLFYQIHEILAWTIISIVTIHILAAFKHHYFDRDNILKRMLPRF